MYRNSESDAMAYIKSLSERLLLEREDMLSKMSAVRMIIAFNIILAHRDILFENG